MDQINVHTLLLLAKFVSYLGSIKVKRHTLPEISMYTRLFGTLKLFNIGKGKIFSEKSMLIFHNRSHANQCLYIMSNKSKAM